MLANFIPATGRISFVGVTITGVGILEGIAWMRYRTEEGRLCQANLAGNGYVVKTEALADVHGAGTQQVLHSPASRSEVKLTYRIKQYDQRSFLMFQLSVHNQGKQPIYLQDLCLFQADRLHGGRVEIPDPMSGLRFFKVGWHAWAYSGLRTAHQGNPGTWSDSITRLSYFNPVTPRARKKGEFYSEGWCILATDHSALVAGFASTAHQFGQVYVCTRQGHEALALTAQADGIRLDPGEICDSDWAYLQFIALPNPDPAADYIQVVSRQMQARIPVSPPPPMWTHWYHFNHHITEQLLLQNVESMVKIREFVPFQVVELDDGYQSAWGDWTTTNDKFPHGLQYLSEQITQQGFIPGLWLSPLVVEYKSHIAREHPNWLVRDSRGKPAQAGFFYFKNVKALDASHPAVLEHLHQLMDTLVHQWGYGMFKLDFLNAGALPGKRYNPKLTRAECLRLALETIRSAVGENTYLLASGCPFGPAIGLLDAMRIGPDTAPDWEPRLTGLKWLSPFVKSNPSMPSLRNALHHTVIMSSIHRRWWWNDPDCLLVRDKHTHLTQAEVQSAVTLVGLSGGLLVSSDDLRKFNPERLHWLTLLVPDLGLRGLPVDWLENEMPSLYRVKIPPRAGNHQGWQLVGLFNWRDKKADCHLFFTTLGFSLGAKLHVFDFWSGRYQQVTQPELIFPGVPAHGCRLLRVSEAGTAPQLVGDTLHISQGVELTSWKVDGDHLSIETIDLGRRADGEIWLWLPGAPIRATCNGEQVRIDLRGENIYSSHLQFFGKASIEVIL